MCAAVVVYQRDATSVMLGFIHAGSYGKGSTRVVQPSKLVYNPRVSCHELVETRTPGKSHGILGVIGAAAPWKSSEFEPPEPANLLSECIIIMPPTQGEALPIICRALSG